MRMKEYLWMLKKKQVQLVLQLWMQHNMHNCVKNMKQPLLNLRYISASDPPVLIPPPQPLPPEPSLLPILGILKSKFLMRQIKYQSIK